MHPTVVALCGLVALLAFVLLNLKTLQNAISGPLSKLPGPWHSHLSNLRLKLAVLAGARPHYINSLHELYGPIVRLTPEEISLGDPDSYKVIYNVRGGFTKSDWYAKASGVDLPSLLTMMDPKEHAARRRLLMKGFQKANLRRDWESTVHECVKTAVAGMKSDSKLNSGVADVYKWWSLLTADVAGYALFGDSFGTLASGQKTRFVMDLENFFQVAGIGQEFPFLLNIPVVQNLFKPKDFISEYAQRAVVAAKDPSSASTRSVFATILAEADKSDTNLTDEMISEESANLTVAGSETTGVTLTYLTWAVLRDPRVREKLEAEVNALSDAEINDATLEGLPYLDAVIHEALRLYCAAPGSLMRVVPRGGTQLCGQYIPEGTLVSAQAWTLHRREDLWGSDVLEFRPERWTEKEGVSEEALAAFRPWGGDPRTCMGIHLARMELRLGAAIFFRECKGSKIVEDGDKDMVEENYFLTKPKGKKCLVDLAS